MRGEVGPMWTELESNAPSEPTDWKPLALEWIPEQATFEGWERVRLEQMREFSGGGVPSMRSDCGEVDAP